MFSLNIIYLYIIMPNILLTKRMKNNKRTKELKKKYLEDIKEQKEKIIYNKNNPDIIPKFQEDKNERNKKIVLNKLKHENNVIVEEKGGLNKLLQEAINERNKRVIVSKKTIKNRIINQEPITDFNDKKQTIDELKKMIEDKIEQGKKDNQAILDFYN